MYYKNIIYAVMILVIIAVVILVAYIATAVCLFGIPRSISETYYLYDERRKGLGCVFTLFMEAEAFLMIGPMLSIGYSEWWQFLGFFCPVGIGLCGSAALFHEKDVRVVHVIGALLGVLSGLIWCFMVDAVFAGIIAAVLSVACLALSLFSKTLRGCYTFWLEIAGFGTIAITLLYSS